jgi:type VI secretion system secreted protein VgrG
MLFERTIEIIPPAEAGALMFERMTGGEKLGRLFEFDIDVLSKNDRLPMVQILGKSVSVGLARALPGQRWWNGIVARIERAGKDGEFYRYRMKVVPLMWVMTRASNCKIYQHTTVPDLILSIFSSYGITAHTRWAYDKYPKWDYLVQYNETDFNFVNRVMEQEGLYYYFTHEKGTHNLVIADGLTIPEAVTGYEGIHLEISETLGLNPNHDECIDSWGNTLQIEPGTFSSKEFDYNEPGRVIFSEKKAPNPHGHSPHTHAETEHFEYPGFYIKKSDIDDYTERRLEADQLDFQQVQGTGNSPGITPGFRFALLGDPAPPEGDNPGYLVTEARYSLSSNQHASGGGDNGPAFSCSFSGIDSKRHYRSPLVTPKPTVGGPQTAIVVGPAGKEIWTDDLGRVRVKFHWDRSPGKNENSSLPVRVAHVWAGGGWGGVHIPRIGQEVVVDFLEGDPDRPIVTGCVYNGSNKPPFIETKSGIRSHTTPGGGPSNFNELMFEDDKGHEQVHLQAEKDLEILVKNDEHREVKHDRKKEVGNDETTKITGNRAETVIKDETITINGKRVETVGTDQTPTSEIVTINGTRTHKITKDESTEVNGDQTIDVTTGNRKLHVKQVDTTSVDADQTITVGGARTLTVKKDDTNNITGGQTVNVTGDQIVYVKKKISIKADEEIKLETGSASILMKKDGTITIKGKDITIEGTGKMQIKGAPITIDGKGGTKINPG